MEGLSCSGKSTLAFRLEEKLKAYSLSAVVIEGDLFQKSREESMITYKTAIANIEGGEQLELDFPERIWDYGKMGREIFFVVHGFNESELPNGEIILRRVLEEKKPNTEHDKRYSIGRDTIVIIAGMYLRHISSFDFIIHLEADPEVCNERKIKRTLVLGYNEILQQRKNE